MTTPTITLGELSRLLNTPLDESHDAGRVIAGVAALDDAGPDDLSYIAAEKYLDRFAATKAAAVIAPLKLALPESPAVVFRVKDPELALAGVLSAFAPPTPAAPVGLDPTAVVDATATVAATASIGPNVYVGPGASIGEGAVIQANTVISANVRVGRDCLIYPNVTLREHVSIGDRVILHSGVVIGADGFGYRWDGTKHAKIPQIGTVVIEDDVEIGANSCVDRAKFGVTRIGRGTKIDNLVQVGHNVVTGAHCVLCGQVGLAGSTTLGNGVVMGGGGASAGHLHVADGTMLAARGGFSSDTKKGEVLAGAPAIPHRQWLREQAAIRALPELVKRVRELERLISSLQNDGRPSTPA